MAGQEMISGSQEQRAVVRSDPAPSEAPTMTRVWRWRRQRCDAVSVVWAMYGLVAAATIVTYWRLPPGATYHFTDSGASGALSRTITYLNFPVAIAAIAVAWAVCSTRVALIVGGFCGAVFIPGVATNLAADWSNLPAVIGVALAVPYTLAQRDPASRPLSRARKTLIGALLLWSVPWMIATAGLYAEDLPLLGRILMSRDPTPGHRSLASVHLGLHDGMFGVMLAITALVLSSRRLARGLSLYLSLLLVYGMALAAQDGWNEQFVKRGWSGTDLPDIMQPSPGLPWLVLLLATVAVHMIWFSRTQSDEARGDRVSA